MVTLDDFRNTDPSNYGDANANIYVTGTGPYTIKALTFPLRDSNPGNIKAVLQQVNEIRFTFVSETRKVTVTDRQIQTGQGSNPDYMYLKLSEISVSSLPTTVIGGEKTEEDSRFVFIPYFSFNFLTDDFNILINNSERSKLSVSRRIVDRVSSQANPTNLIPIISQSATFAEVQECNYTKRSVITSRYLGSKLNSGSVKFNDPALTFIPFKASVHGTSLNYDKIVSIPLDQREIETLYFNPVFPGDLKSVPTEGRPVYREDGNKFIRLENVKFYIPDTEVIGVISSGSTTTTAVYSTNQIAAQTLATGSALIGSQHYEYSVYNYNTNVVGEINYASGSNDSITEFVTNNSGITICASKINSYTNVGVVKQAPC